MGYSPWGDKKSDTTEQLSTWKSGAYSPPPPHLKPVNGFDQYSELPW